MTCATLESPLVPLRKLAEVTRRLNAEGVRYCHWKSNYHLHYALAGCEDLDLLVHRQDFDRFTCLLLELDFKEAESISSAYQTGVYHFLGNDESTGALLNVHVCAQTLTGDHILKSYALPLEEMLLSSTRDYLGVAVPSKPAELVIFVLREMLKHTTMLDLYLHGRHMEPVREEAAWLLAGMRLDDALEELGRHFPEIPPRDFHRALESLQSHSSILLRWRLGVRFRRRLRKFQRYGFARRIFFTWMIVGRTIGCRLSGSRKTMTLRRRGAVIALVGPPATGKSTIASSIREWLGGELRVHQIHAGKPPSTAATFLVNALVPLARRLLSGQRTIKIEAEAQRDDSCHFPTLYLVRNALLAYERKRLLTRAFRRARNGAIVISDRYPSDNAGAIDGASFRDEVIARERSKWRRWLMSLERNFYQATSPPTLVVKLEAGVDTAVVRNALRDKPDPKDETYVRQRYEMAHLPVFGHCPVVEFSSEREFDDMIVDLKNVVWKHL